MPEPSIALDVTPLQNAHRFRGIGAYVRGLAQRLSAQSQIPIEFWGWTGELDFAPPAPHKVRLLPRFPMPQYRAAWWFARLGMRRRTASSNVRAIHITDPNALTPIASRKVLTTVYDLIPLREGVPWRQPLTRLGYKTYLKALDEAEILFAISEQTAADLMQLLHVPTEKIVLATPGVEVTSAPGPSAPRVKPFFLFAGGPNPNKNLNLVLEAMQLGPELPEELLIAGRWLPQQVSALDKRLEADGLRNRVHHLGFVSDADLMRLMRDATAVVVPSLFEGFGLPVAEGMSAGAVVVHSRIPVLIEVSRGAALMFDPHRPGELLQNLREASRDAALRDRLRAAGLQRATELTWDTAVANTIASYRKILRN